VLPASVQGFGFEEESAYEKRACTDTGVKASDCLTHRIRCFCATMCLENLELMLQSPLNMQQVALPSLLSLSSQGLHF
jgi:hypothetical protein